MSLTSQRRTIPITDYKVGDWVSINPCHYDYAKNVKGMIIAISYGTLSVKWTYHYTIENGAVWTFSEKDFLDYCVIDPMTDIIRLFELTNEEQHSKVL